MSVDPIGFHAPRQEAPRLKVVEASGTEIFENYMQLRDESTATPDLPSEELDAIQQSVGEWIHSSGLLDEPPDYASYDRAVVEAKLGGLLDFLKERHIDKVPLIDIETTRAFIDSSFIMYGEKDNVEEVHPDADGSFAFLVPIRMSRKNPEYGKETEPAIPAFKYIPLELRPQMLVGIPPRVIDTYKRDEQGRRGYLVFTPIYEDMAIDLGRSKALEVARATIDNTADFAQRRLGVGFIGLGGTIPGLTHYGKAIDARNDVMVTNGHGGTIHLAKEIIYKAAREGLIDGRAIKKLGMLGLGAIGGSLAEVLADEFPDSELKIYDEDTSKIKRTTKNLARAGANFAISDGAADLINDSDIVISAITSRVDLNTLEGLKTMDGKLVVDDGQPGSFQLRQVNEKGGNLVWVIGRDTQDKVVRHSFGYGSLVNPTKDLFGCEAEVAALARYSGDLKERGFSDSVRRRILAKVAVREAATPQKVRLIGALLRKFGIGPADFQVFGQSLQPKEKH